MMVSFEKGGFSHYPFVSMTQGNGIVEFFKGGSIVQYFSKTSCGMSGGSIEFHDKIVGSDYLRSRFDIFISSIEACIMLGMRKKGFQTVYCLQNR